ncbi:MAG: hypothetical protein R2932_19070 [Caldilineaceae bacterium]
MIQEGLTRFSKLPAASRTSIVTRVQELSGGHPLNNYFLTLEFAKHWGKNGITDSDIAASLDRLINLLLRDQQEKRDYFEALCVLEGFREWEVSTLLDIYLSTNTYREQPRQVRHVVNTLLETHLVQWAEESKVYVINESVRYILEEFLKRRRELMWRRLHEGALALYQSWIKKQPKSSLFRERARYHANILGVDVDSQSVALELSVVGSNV